MRQPLKELVAIIAVLGISSGTAQAATDYRCVIERVVAAGPVRSNIQTFNERAYVGKEFTVNRQTGVMAGALSNAYVTRPIVIDFGSDENSYKVVTTMRKEEGAGAGSNVYVLTVNEFDESPNKPFLFVRNDVAFFGICTHF